MPEGEPATEGGQVPEGEPATEGGQMPGGEPATEGGKCLRESLRPRGASA